MDFLNVLRKLQFNKSIDGSLIPPVQEKNIIDVEPDPTGSIHNM